MRTYETLVILTPELAGEELTAMIEKLQGVLESQGVEVLKVDNWGTRKLAYLIRKQARGTYVLMIYQAEGEVIAEFERRLRIDDAVLKFQTVYLEDGYQEPVVEPVAEAAVEAGTAGAADDEGEADAEA